MAQVGILSESIGHRPVFFSREGNYVLWNKNALRGSSWVGREFCRRSDPPQAEKLARFFFAYFWVVSYNFLWKLKNSVPVLTGDKQCTRVKADKMQPFYKSFAEFCICVFVLHGSGSIFGFTFLGCMFRCFLLGFVFGLFLLRKQLQKLLKCSFFRH